MNLCRGTTVATLGGYGRGRVWGCDSEHRMIKKNTYLCKGLLSGSKYIKTMVSIMRAKERKEEVLANGVIVREFFSERAEVEQILEE